MVGFYLPYEIMLGDSMSYCRGFCYYPTANTLLGRMELHAFESLRFETDPLTRHMFRIAYAGSFTSHWLELRDQMQDGVATAIRAMPRNTLTFVHYPLPHAPFIFNEDGRFRGVYSIDFDRPTGYLDGAWGTVEEYQRQLGYLDHVIGGFMDELKRSGKFDDALIILTSDHSWRFDPDTRLRAETRRWVPLLVKLPGQRHEVDVDTPFPNAKLGAFARHVMSGSSGDPEVEAIISRAQSARAD
jgi:arylsulfatase A-like enzyme